MDSLVNYKNYFCYADNVKNKSNISIYVPNFKRWYRNRLCS